MRTKIVRNIFISVGLLFALTGPLAADKPQPQPIIITFNAPDAGPFGTVGLGINPEGVIAGDYADASFVFHGFVRAKDGTITTFDPPSSIGTFMADGGCINPAGLIVGQYFDATFVQHGFVRAPDGAVSQDRCSGCGPIRHRRPGRQPGRND